MIIGITGANGYIGRYLTEKLADLPNHEVIAFVRSTKAVEYFFEKGINVIRCDLEDRQACVDLVGQVDSVIHLAHSGYPLSQSGDLVASTIKNITPTLNLLDAIRFSSNPVRLIYASSGGTVYAMRKTRRSFQEIDDCAPSTPYGIEKHTLENYIRYYSAAFGFDALIYRLSNPYGVLLESERMQGLIGVALNKILNKEPVKIYGDPGNVRDYLHFDDMVRAFELGLTTSCSSGVYNIGSGVGYTVSGVLDRIENNVGFKIHREYVSNQAAGKLPAWVVLDASKAKEVFGWEPLINLDEGLERLCRSVRIS